MLFPLSSTHVGLTLAWRSGYRNILVETDSLCMVQLLAKDIPVNHPLFSIASGCSALINLDWRCLVSHVYREGNKVADGMARLGMDEEINRLYGDFHIDIDPDPPSTTGPTGAGPSSSTQNSSKKRKKKKSMVWDSFEVIQVKHTDGIEVEHAEYAEWILQKKLLGFRVMDYSHTAQNVHDVIMSVIQDYGIQNLILSITLDNASANSKAIELFDNSRIPNTAVKFFHAHCACHIINLIVKSGLKQVESRIDNIMVALGWIMASNQRIAEFSRYCTSKDILPRKFQIDMPVRWNSTYLMLKSALPYTELITSFYNVNTANDTGHEKLTDDPRFRFNGLEVFSKELGESLGLSETDVAEYLSTLKSQMFEIFSIYENRYSHGTAEQAPPQQQSQQQSKLMRIFFSKATTSRASGLGSSSQSQSQSQSQRQHVELNRYLTTKYSITESDDFTTNDLLKWWRGKRNNFPILSRLACDVLAIPVSTVSSEQVFSTARRILEERRCSLAHDAVEALTCLKDWQNATFRRQHQPDTEELMDDFSNMTIEESSGSNQPTS
ncbi:hypothetical protein Dsin_018942 [Dipteronia sinensis]|uniref:Transposase n=1 Tax=Dipteronia sinensis TaxID=43782 RepID=A0AAE0E2J1_9ROSI|nr:hypothetical protein Dsin_018942 [Dipteronia sinensis]